MKFFSKIRILLLLVSVAYAQRIYPSAANVESAATAINNIIDEQTIGRKNKEFPFIGGFVRLSFHDCVGGCDGCINHSNEDNKGLFRYTQELDIKYTQFSGIMSRADFYMLAGYVAASRATAHQANAEDRIDWRSIFKVGRLSCSETSSSSTTTPNPNFPSANQRLLGDMDAFFAAHFPSFTTTDKVAIMGAHSLGRCSIENSGFEGTWVRGKANGRVRSDLLDHEYYKQQRGNWIQLTLSSGKIQWQRPDTPANTGTVENRKNQPNMFLNVDMSIQWNLATKGSVGTNGEVSCKPNLVINACSSPANDCCVKASTNNRKAGGDGVLFNKYVRNNTLFISDFKNAFVKMTETGSPSGSLQFPG